MLSLCLLYCSWILSGYSIKDPIIILVSNQEHQKWEMLPSFSFLFTCVPFSISYICLVVSVWDGSVIWNQRSAWDCRAHYRGRIIKEERWALAVTSSNMTAETVAVTKSMTRWQIATHVYIFSDPMSILRKVKIGWMHKQWIESVLRSRLHCVIFIFMPGQGSQR